MEMSETKADLTIKAETSLKWRPKAIKANLLSTEKLFFLTFFSIGSFLGESF